jgi:hypothetical protein
LKKFLRKELKEIKLLLEMSLLDIKLIKLKELHDSQDSECKDFQDEIDIASKKLKDIYSKYNNQLRNIDREITDLKKVLKYRNEVQEIYNKNTIDLKNLSDIFVGNRFSVYELPDRRFDVMEAFLITNSRTLSLNEKLSKLSDMIYNFGLQKLDLVKEDLVEKDLVKEDLVKCKHLNTYSNNVCKDCGFLG